MKPIRRIIVRGLFFVLPLFVFLMLIAWILGILKPLAAKILDTLNIHNLFGISLIYFFSIFLLLLLCYLAGVVSMSPFGKKVWKKMDEKLMNIPLYSLIKGNLALMTGQTTNPEERVVLVPIDGWMIAFVREELPSGEVVVFVPGSPNAWSGNVLLFDKMVIKESKLTYSQATAILRSGGFGLKEALTNKK